MAHMQNINHQINGHSVKTWPSAGVDNLWPIGQIHWIWPAEWGLE